LVNRIGDERHSNSEAIRMSAATVCLSAASRVPTMCAAILFTGRCRTFTRCVSAFFGRFRVVHFSLLMSKKDCRTLALAWRHCFRVGRRFIVT
jgi:hypothetical protein